MKISMMAALAAGVVAAPAMADSLTAQFANQPASISRGDRVASGSFGGINWTAASKIVGAASTGGINGGGDARYFAPMPKYSGVVSLIMDYGPGGAFICSGALLPDRVSILTAAHCVSDGAGTPNPRTTTVRFYGGPNPDTRLHTSTDPAVKARQTQNYYVNAGYTGEVIDQNDIAVLRLKNAAPVWATSYELSTLGADDLVSTRFNVAGYGGRSSIGGTFGNNQRTGFLRQGDNRYEWRLGDPAFDRTPGAFPWQAILGGTAQKAHSWMSDFDNGLAANDTGCRIAAASNFAPGLNGPKYCDTGVTGTPNMEVSVAGGDSGGPQFVDGKITSVTSFGLTFGTAWGDVRAGLNSSFGEFNGFVPVYIHQNFIASAMAVPEPSNWAMLIAGFGLIGATLRRRQAAVAA